MRSQLIRRRRQWYAGGVMLLAAAHGGCQRERQHELSTSVAALTPAALTPAAERLAARENEANIDAGAAIAARGPSRVCPDVEQQARELGAALPRVLDADTIATGVTASGCDLTLEYQLVTLSARDVQESGLLAMRARVREQLCADTGALGVLLRGGRFTNVYYDSTHTRIGLFTVAADDCGI
jgi:hypothetical protein